MECPSSANKYKQTNITQSKGYEVILIVFGFPVEIELYFYWDCTSSMPTTDHLYILLFSNPEMSGICKHTHTHEIRAKISPNLADFWTVSRIFLESDTKHVNANRDPVK